MFSKGVRAGHEPQSGELIEKILGLTSGRIHREELTNWVRARDRNLRLQVDSSQLNFFLLDILLKEFPDARFILTIRDAYSWLDSYINHVLHYPQASLDWMQMRDFHFRVREFTHAPQEQVLEKAGLHTLDGYLSYWATHNRRTIACVPAERLLILRTDQIRERAYEIADFAGLPRRSVNLEGTHSFKNPEKFGLLRQINRHFLEEKVRKHCGTLMKEFFSEIKSLDCARV